MPKISPAVLPRLVGWLLVCFTFQQHASVSWGHRGGPVSWNCLFALRSSNMLVHLGDIAGAGIMELLVCFTFQQHASVSWGHRVGPVSWNCLFALRSSNMLVYLGDIEWGRYHGIACLLYVPATC